MKDVAKRHQRKIAKETMRMTCLGAVILGIGHKEAAKVLGKKPPKECSCT